MNPVSENINNTAKEIKKETKGKIVGYITAGFGFVAGLAWNEAIVALINELFPVARNTIFVKFIYAGIMTIILIAVSIYITRILQEEKN